MAGITGLGTTYNLPNYTGILHLLSRAETPFFSAIGGLAAGGQTTETSFEWETYDMRDAAQPAGIVEGADAPTSQSRVRASVSNVVQIHQEAVSVSYWLRWASSVSTMMSFRSLRTGCKVPGSERNLWIRVKT